MKRSFLAVSAILLVLGAIGFSNSTRTGNGVEIELEGRNPWTHLRFNNQPDMFHFAVVSDRTGGHRARIFSQAVHQLNLLQPDFVVTVGDLIEGYTKDTERIGREWKEFQGFVNKLQMPFFYVPGNHDLANSTLVKEWRERFGRRYYHFVYRDVLFLALASDDEGEDKGNGAISKEQVEYVQSVLKAYPTSRWTVVIIHKPIWALSNAKADGWNEIEKSLEGRKYTVFAGHFHRFRKFNRNGMNYYQLATTGGISKMRGLAYNEFDHITWVTMKSDGPVVSHILLDGILPDDLKKTVTTEEGYVRHNTKPVHPVKGTVLFEGSPVPGAKVVFNMLDAAKKSLVVADAIAEDDGSFALTTYSAWDGAPVGEYHVTVTLQQPLLDGSGQLGPNLMPTKYASALTTDLKVQVRTGQNDFVLNLMP